MCFLLYLLQSCETKTRVARARNLSRVPRFANLILDSVRQAKAENSLVLRARTKAWPRYWRSLAWWQGPCCNGPLTPLGRFLNRSSPGRTESQFPIEENRNAYRQEAMAEPKGAEGTGAAAACRGPWPGGSPSTRCRRRCGQWCALRRRAAGLRFATRKAIRVFHSRSASFSRLVTKLRSADGGHAIDRGVLDPAVRHFVGTGDSSVFGECQRHEEFAGTQDGHPRMSVAVEIARLRTAAQFVPAGRGNSGDADVLATEGRILCGRDASSTCKRR